MRRRPAAPSRSLFRPAWAFDHPWRWSTFTGFVTATLFFGIAHYELHRAALPSAVFALAIAAVQVFPTVQSLRDGSGRVPRWIAQPSRWLVVAVVIIGAESLLSAIAKLVADIVGNRSTGRTLFDAEVGALLPLLSVWLLRDWRLRAQQGAAIWPFVRAAERDPASHTAVTYASPLRRLAGRIIDTVVVVAVPMLIAGAATETSSDAVFVAAVSAAVVGFSAVYEITLVALFGRTLGKLVTGTKVLASWDLQRPGWSKSAARWAVAFLLAISVVGVAGFTLVIWGQERQGIHDRLADTIVVAVRGTNGV
ncbi:MAG: RDD family protein [Actinobacteria bacterium]|nr:RDD family protein [Actinomycetota bacterium]